MLVGLGGSNGTTFYAGLTANKYNIKWRTKKGEKTPNFYGSITQASTTKVGVSGPKEVFLPLNKIMPLVNPNDVTISGWDISALNLADSMKRAEVLEYDLQK